MKTLPPVIFALALNFGLFAADTIPPELVGEWVEPNSKFSWGVLQKGSAIYLSSTGFVAWIGWPGPIGEKGTATYDPKTLTLTLVLSDGSKKKTPNKLLIAYDPKVKKLTTKATDDVVELSLTRRQKRIPKWVWDL